MSQAAMASLRGRTIAAYLKLSGWNVADRFERPLMGEPVYPFQCLGLDLFEIASFPALANDFRLVDPDDRLAPSCS